MTQNVRKIDEQKEKKHKRYGLPVFVMLLCVIGFISAFRYGSATLDYYNVRNAIDQWEQNNTIESKAHFFKITHASDRAAFIHDGHPLYHDIKGQVIEWGVINDFYSTDELARAKEAYGRAMQLRPTWPVTWASLAMIKWRQQQFDDELLMYLDNANSLGPKQPEVHVLFSRLGLSLYRANHPFFVDIRDIVIMRVSQGLKSVESRSPILQHIQDTETLNDVCRWLKNDTEYVKQHILKCP